MYRLSAVRPERVGDLLLTKLLEEDADKLLERMLAIPGFGEYKARIYVGLLAKRFGVRPRGYTKHLPSWPSIVDVASPDDLAELKARKKAWKESQQ